MSHDPKTTTSLKTTIAPMLSVRKGAKAIEFYKAAFGVEELFHNKITSLEAAMALAFHAAQYWPGAPEPNRSAP